METNKNYLLGQNDRTKEGTLTISCFDTIEVKARVTFDAETVDGIQITYWMDDDRDIKDRVNKIFDYLFDEIFKVEEEDYKK